jgi:hypothetical protein
VLGFVIFYGRGAVTRAAYENRKLFLITLAKEEISGLNGSGQRL